MYVNCVSHSLIQALSCNAYYIIGKVYLVYLKLIISMRVAQIASGDLGGHVPAVEGHGRKLESTTIKGHAGHSWKGIPAKPELGEPIVPEWMCCKVYSLKMQPSCSSLLVFSLVHSRSQLAI